MKGCEEQPTKVVLEGRKGSRVDVSWTGLHGIVGRWDMVGRVHMVGRWMRCTAWMEMVGTSLFLLAAENVVCHAPSGTSFIKSTTAVSVHGS